MKASEAAERAAHYVEEHGDAFARQRARALLGEVSAATVVDGLAPDTTRAGALREALGVCDDLRSRSGTRVRAFAEAAHALQAADGGWAPDLPLPDRLFETGMLAGQLAKTPFARPEGLAAAGDFLAAHWSPDLVRSGSWHAIAAYAHFFANADHEAADAVLQWCGRELGRAFLTRHFDAVRTVRVLCCCDAHGLPGADLKRGEILIALISEQAPDGSWSAWSGEGARDAVGSTLDGLVGLLRMGA